jgi:hypothetical protein
MRLIDVRSSFTYSDDSITFIGRKLDDNWHILDGKAYVVWCVSSTHSFASASLKRQRAPTPSRSVTWSRQLANAQDRLTKQSVSLKAHSESQTTVVFNMDFGTGNAYTARPLNGTACKLDVPQRAAAARYTDAVTLSRAAVDAANGGHIVAFERAIETCLQLVRERAHTASNHSVRDVRRVLRNC